MIIHFESLIISQISICCFKRTSLINKTVHLDRCSEHRIFAVFLRRNVNFCIIHFLVEGLTLKIFLFSCLLCHVDEKLYGVIYAELRRSVKIMEKQNEMLPCGGFFSFIFQIYIFLKSVI